MIVAIGKRSWLIGTTGVVKTPTLREVARLPDDVYKKVVVVVDTPSLHSWTYLWHALIGSRNPLHLRSSEAMEQTLTFSWK